MPEFDQIAQVGGGESFLTSDERQIITQLLVLVIGSHYRSKVLEAFDLMEHHRQRIEDSLQNQKAAFFQ